MAKLQFVTGVLFSLLVFGSATASYNANSIEIFTKKYESLLEMYSNLPESEKEADVFFDLVSLHSAGTTVGYLDKDKGFVSDLFRNEDQNICFLDYLDRIKDYYENRIEVQFSNERFFSCTNDVSGRTFAYVMVDKHLRYLGSKEIEGAREKKLSLLLCIDVTDDKYTVNTIMLPERHASKGNCPSALTKQTESIAMVNDYVLLGDVAFARKDYISARDVYYQALLLQPQNTSIISKVERCTDAINFSQYQTTAEKYFAEGSYNKAKESFGNILALYPEQRKYAQNKIEECDGRIKSRLYEKYRNSGDDYYKQEFYTPAKEQYSRALSYKANDAYVLDMIRKCSYAPPSAKIKQEIKQAISLAENNKKAEAFKIMYYYERSGLLTGQNYYFMAMMMSGTYQHVDKKMGFSKTHCKRLARQYCIKAIDQGSMEAREAWDNHEIR